MPTERDALEMTTSAITVYNDINHLNTTFENFMIDEFKISKFKLNYFFC